MASPGYYAVDLELPLAEDKSREWPPAERKVKAEITSATSHTGFHRYTFPILKVSAPQHRTVSVLVDACHTASADVEPLGHVNGEAEADWHRQRNEDNSKQSCAAATITVNQSAQTFSGWVDNRGALTGRASTGAVRVHFFASLTASCGNFPNDTEVLAASGMGAWADYVLLPASPNRINCTTASSSNASGSAGAFLTFPQCSNGKILMAEIAVGISFIDTMQARANLEQALRNISAASANAVLLADFKSKSNSVFEKARAVAQNLWRRQLAAVQVGL